jgi:germination protein YpeB
VFADRNLEKVTVLGSNSITLQTFNLVGKTDNGDIYAEVSKIGGKLIMFDIAGSCKKVNYQQDYAIDCAKEFLQKLEILGMQAVWTNLANNVYTINFAYSQNDIIIYPDMIKVRVCAETGKVIGMEATSYYANHTQRSLDAPSYSKGQGSQKLANNMLIESVRLVVCPIGLNQEKLCYEFYGEINGESYYIYLDANTLKQVEMFKVVEGSEGLLLM